MSKRDSQPTVGRDFVIADEADLNAQIAAFRAEHEAEHGQRLAMDARRPLGANKVRITFRIVDAPAGRGKRR